MNTQPRVRLIGDPVLRAPAGPVTDVADPSFRSDAEALLATLAEFRRTHGFGRAIAAPQIGVSCRLVAANLGEGAFLLVNPRITRRSDQTMTLWDDCMSLPWLMVKVRRHRSVSLAYSDQDGHPREWNDLDPSTSELMQHELDHLDGVLTLDRAEDVVAREAFERRRDELTAEVDYSIPPLPRAEPAISVRPLTDEDREWVDRTIRELWGSDVVVAHGETYRPAELAGFVATAAGEPAGVVTYRIDGEECEIVTIDAFTRWRGVGTRLVDAVAERARAAGCRRLFLITTNDNLDGLRFYQRRGFRLAALRPGAIDRAREIKPEISRTGDHAIPIHDEIELERLLDA
jgi:peptide deformylase